MFSLFTKSNDAMDLTCLPKIRNRDLPLQLQQPPLLQRLKRTTLNFLKISVIFGIVLFVVIMSFGDGTRAKQALVNFSIGDTWQATVALMQNNFNEKSGEETKSDSSGKR